MFEVGDKVKCIDGSGIMNLMYGKVYKVTGVSGVNVKVNKEVDKDDWCLGQRFELVPQFDLKKNPWFVRTGTKEKSEAAQKWLFEQGFMWNSGHQVLIDYKERFLGLQGNCSFKVIDAPVNGSQEIILEFETVVKSVTYPVVESEQDKKIKELQQTIDKAQQQLEEMMGNS